MNSSVNGIPAARSSKLLTLPSPAETTPTTMPSTGETTAAAAAPGRVGGSVRQLARTMAAIRATSARFTARGRAGPPERRSCPGSGAPGRGHRFTRGTARARRRARLVRRQVEDPERVEPIAPARHGRSERLEPTGPIDEDRALDDLAAGGLDGRDHREERAACCQDVVHQEDPLAGADLEAAPELPAGLSVSLDLLREDRSRPELAARLERENHAARRRAGDEVDRRAIVGTAVLAGPEAAQLAGRRGVGKDGELLQVRVRVATALEEEVAVTERTGASKERLGAGGDRGTGRAFDALRDRRHRTQCRDEGGRERPPRRRSLRARVRRWHRWAAALRCTRDPSHFANQEVAV